MIFNRKYYKLCFIIYMFINTLALGYLGIETNYLFIPLLIWALVIIGHDIYKKEFKIKKNYSLLMLVQGFILLLATILNSYSDLNSYVIAIMQLVIYLLIFNNPASMTKKDIVEEVKMIIPLVNVLVGFASLVSIGMFIVGFSSLANGWTLGMVGSRLFGVYFNSNPAAFLACITIVLALIAIRENFKGKPWYLVNIGVQIVYILLTKCRVALIILVVIIIMVGYYFLIRRRPYSMFKRIMLVLGLVFIITSASLLGQGIVEFVPQMQGIASKETSRFQTDKIKEAGHLLISGDIEDFYKGLTIIDEVSNGRVSLTKAALQIWQTDPLIGIGANNFKKIGIQETDVLEYWAVQVVHSHNVFLEALVTTGVIGFIIFVIFFFKCVLMSFNVLKVSQGKEIYFIVQMFIMIVLSEFIGGLSDYGVFYIYSLSATLAWCFLGYLFTYQNIINSSDSLK
ncbi:O-antigen ligase family protein [Thomasclavelia cocleata]|uniref:O-antigen ligase family protein n=2 Tax=Thomasclavelia cocleata TaxID=69824 RepID=UPI00242E97EA|nr:O-antigen ligase family protein [Thomasclavelia cocleata]